MSSSIYEQTRLAISELCEKAKLKAGNIVVVGCSTSEVIGSKIGTNSSPEAAAEIFTALHEYTQSQGLHLAIQCCEHLNRAIITERSAVPFAEPINVVPQPKAGGSFATLTYENLKSPVLVESIRAHAGIDIGGTLIGMHLKAVAVPVRLSISKIGEANILCAKTRPKYIGGERAKY